MVLFSQIILFVGLLCVPLLTRFANHLTAHIDRVMLDALPRVNKFRVIKRYFTLVFILKVRQHPRFLSLERKFPSNPK